MSRRRPAELNGPELPVEMAYLWAMFNEIQVGRQGNGFGPNLMSWSDLESYFRLQAIRIEPWELRLLRRLDRLAIELMAPKPTSK